MNANTPRVEILRDALRQVMDPEIGVNIVDLGLVYDIRLDGAQVRVQMTATTPGCPMQDSLARGVEMVLLCQPGVEAVEVEMVWEPPWTPERMSERAREELGITR